MVVWNLAGFGALSKGEAGPVRSLELERGRGTKDFRFSSRAELVSSCFLSFFGWKMLSMEKEDRGDGGGEGGEVLFSIWLAVSFRWRALTTPLTALDEVRGDV